MEVKLESAPVLMVLQCLYKDAQRASLVAQEVMAKHHLKYEQVQKLLEGLRDKELITNIEKNKSNGDAVYKLTRLGEKLLEERIPPRYQKARRERESLTC
jgi:predicted transcriptional regulator